MKIKNIQAYQIYDSRGKPTVEALITTTDNVQATALVPSGASTGQYEALELRDNDPDYLQGNSVLKAVQHIEDIIAPELMGMDINDQETIDRHMAHLDGTKDKSKLGANAILAVSMAVAKVAAKSKNIPLFAHLGDGDLLPLPEIQLIGGGAHAGWCTDIQDFLLIACGAQNYAETLEITHNIYHIAYDMLKKSGKLCGVADEGGFWPKFQSNDETFEFIIKAIEKAGYQAGQDVMISLDIAASDLFDGQYYNLSSENKVLNQTEFYELMQSWCQNYPIISIEDPFADTDWDNWCKFTTAFGTKLQIIGDDLFTTNMERINQGIAQKAANSVLIKLNQIGTVTETIGAIKKTQDAGWLPVISARSGETEDAFISHLAVATNAGQLKVGSFSRSDRMVKWNEVIRIDHYLKGKARFIGAQIYKEILK